MSDKVSVLFVDDETSILNALRRMLRNKRNEWEMYFASSGKEALAVLADHDVDVIVTDLRMPQMNGAELLKHIIDENIQCIRIVLTGEVGTSLAYECMGVAHRFLGKPTSCEELCVAVSGSMQMRKFLLDDGLLNAVNGIKNLPTIPAIYEELTDALRSPDVPLVKLGEIIKKDPGMTAKILKVVNSAFFGLKNSVSDPIMAVNYIGIEPIKSLVLSTEAFQHYADESMKAYVEAVWEHSEQVAQICKSIAQSEGMSEGIIETCYMTGLLHDIGSLILAQNFPEKIREKFQQSKSVLDDADGISHEESVFGTTHASIGAYLLGLWNLDDVVIESVAFHHKPCDSVVDGIGPLVILHVADAFSYGFDDVSQFKDRLDFDFLKRISCFDKLPAWKIACVKHMESGHVA
ncbi:MAG: HDOD domain-containing protein [Planctomycetes bacterium]|nr:HDOD domain-containing protein [Planctomycetota bacterium]